MVSTFVDRLIESGRVPDPLVRAGIRLNCAVRLSQERRKGPTATDVLVERLRQAPIADRVEAANAQHYEVPSEFFGLVLGPRRKYSCCYWPPGVETLAAAEEAMLELCCARAGVEDGMDLLDLGCGWGSLSFWLAERYPNARIVAVSNSHSQRRFIQSRGCTNIEVLTADANTLELNRQFDRILSVEMLEHMRNYELLFARIASWLRADGRFFCHVFSHREYAYLYERGWMARRFFTGGTMPSHDLLPRFQRELVLEEDWQVGGEHYARTAQAWLARLDANRAEVEGLFDSVAGVGRGRPLTENWRVFFLACAELWGYRGGSEWIVSHYRFAPRSESHATA